MLQRKDVHIHIQEKSVLQDISLDFVKGKNYCILGKNGSGKSSLALTTMGHPSYEITQGDICIGGESIKDMSPDERAKAGIFLAFQSIPEIKGVKLFEFLRSIYSAKTGENQTFIKFKKHILPLLDELQINREFLRRDLNVGFSGGERRKIEILQLRLLEPTYIFLDEVDSGLDVDAFKSVAKLIKSLNTPDNTFIIITHYFTILDYLPIDIVYVLEDGKLVKTGSQDIAEKIRNEGFSGIE